MTRPIFSESEKQMPKFKKLIDYWNERLNTLRKDNDRPQSDAETAQLRGKIGEIKNMLNFEKDEPVFDE